MSEATEDTIAYYDRNAADFAGQTADLNLGSLYDRFLAHVGAGGRILDAGCGAGRDTLAFAQRGYEVVAFDASPEMVRLARARVGNRVMGNHMRFESVTSLAEFDGIWTCASLLHVPECSFPDVAGRLAVALRPGGAWYMSFKSGSGQRMAGGRLFVDHTEASLRDALKSVPVRIADVWISPDVRPGREAERWLNVVAAR